MNLLLLFLNIFSLLSIHLSLTTVMILLLGHDLFIVSYTVNFRGIIYLYIIHFLMLSIDTQKMHLAARGCTRMRIKMVCLTYVRNDIKIVVLFGQ
jgi:hypothetical protein